MKLTKRKALQETSDMWHWLAKHPSNYKSEYFSQSGKQDPINTCYLCEYAHKGVSGYISNCECNKCPLLKLWGGDTEQFGISAKYNPCEQQSSPFQKWKSASRTNLSYRARLAGKIAQAADKELSKMKPLRAPSKPPISSR